MPEISLVAEPRLEQGSSASRRLRVLGRIPGVVYGHGVVPQPVSVDARALRSALSTEAGANALFDLEVGGEQHLAVARELQRHPVRRTIAHVDFQVVRRDELISAEVPLVIVGEAVAVHRAGGTLEHLLTSVLVRATPSNIPTSIELDISELEIGDTIRVDALVVPTGVSIELDPETLVVVASVPRGIEEEPEAAEAAAAEPASGEQSSES